MSVMYARVFKGKAPDPAGRRAYNKLPPLALYHARCDCGYASAHMTLAEAERSLAEHASHPDTEEPSDA